MGLEDVPEMQLVVIDYDCDDLFRPFQREKDRTFGGKFVLFGAYPTGKYNSRPLRLFIYSENGAESHLDIAPHFTQETYSKYTVDPCKIMFTPIGGGMIEVTESQMKFSGKSDSFGQYNKARTKEIAQRYCASNQLGLKILTL